MRTLTDVGQKIKGKTQQFKGELEMENGQPILGAVDTINSKANEMIADVKLKNRNDREISQTRRAAGQSRLRIDP